MRVNFRTQIGRPFRSGRCWSPQRSFLRKNPSIKLILVTRWVDGIVCGTNWPSRSDQSVSQTDWLTDRPNYRNPHCACAPRVNKVYTKSECNGSTSRCTHRHMFALFRFPTHVCVGINHTPEKLWTTCCARVVIACTAYTSCCPPQYTAVHLLYHSSASIPHLHTCHIQTKLSVERVNNVDM